MKNLFLFLAVLLTNSLYGQGGMKVVALDSKDSIELNKTWKSFKVKFDVKDTKALRQYSLKLIECDMSLITKPHNIEKGIRYLPIDTFLFYAYKNLEASKFWNFQVYQFKGLHPSNLNLRKGQTLKIYEVWYSNRKVGGQEIERTRQLYAFEFVKVDGKFKFFGLSSHP